MIRKQAITLERGLTENIALQVTKTAENYFEDKFNSRLYFTKNDGAWNYNIYNNKRNEEAITFIARGKDIFDAISEMRNILLKECSIKEGVQVPFKNLWEIDKVVDARKGQIRNEVGALEIANDEFDLTLEKLESLKEEILKLKSQANESNS